MLSSLKKDLRKYVNKEKALFYPRFFKSGKGEYAEGDWFIGVTVPLSRKVAKKYKDLSFEDLNMLLQSPIHEERLVSLLILIHKFNNVNQKEKEKLYNYYLSSTKYINNWDLVDLSADKIVGGYLLGKKDRLILVKLAKSKNLWERRIAVIATFQFIKEKKEYRDTFTVSEILLNDRHDLIHKAVGWMLREVGKRVSKDKEEAYLKTRYKQMPRTMLRYAIEHFPESRRKQYLQGTV